MAKKALWFLLSVMLVTALMLLFSTGVTTAGKEEPQYGGTLTFLHAAGGWEPDKWDPIEYSKAQESYYIGYYLEGLLAGDLSRGARGSNEYWFCDSYWVPDPYITGQLAARWKFTDPLTVEFKLRKGVMWQDKPGVMAAREMNSADVVFSWNRLIKAKKKLGTRYEWMEAVSAPDKYTVVLKLSKFSADWLWRITARQPMIIPPELEKVGIESWKNAVGTGPFKLTKYVKGSSLTYERNPNYWGKTTIDGKEYRLPFIDKLVLPMIVDDSTRLAALRTGKADILETIGWEFRKNLKRTNPDLREFRPLGGGAAGVVMREDTPPFNDKRVRRALSMAVDRKAYVDSQLGGESVPLSWPFSAAWPKEYFTPLNEYPAEVQENFQYNPEKAKKLLAEAGYPNGFQAGILFSSTNPTTADICSMLVSHWKKIGVTVALKPKEQGAFVGILYGKKYKDMIYLGFSNSSPISIMRNCGEPGDFYNLSMFNHPDWYQKFMQAKGERDYAKHTKLMKECNQYFVSSANVIILPTGYTNRYAQPWVNNYYGETNVASLNRGPIYATVWLDSDMKAKKK